MSGDRGTPVPLHGFLGGTSIGYEHRVGLQIESLTLDMDIAFSTQPLHRQVLGRDVLNHLVLGVRERCMEVYLGPENAS